MLKYVLARKNIYMKVIGIIAEYNPFHNGHIHQIKEIKKLYKDSIIICIVSSSFTQNGSICLIDKWNKTNILLKHNIDIVVELPYVYSTQSSDSFASGALSILKELKIDYLSFGSECNNIDLLTKISDVELNNKYFDKETKYNIDKGLSYPVSINNALKKLINIELKDPNDLLAVSYIKYIMKNNLPISLLPIKRTSNYSSTTEESNIISATNIRNKLINNEDILSYVPKGTYDILKNYKTSSTYYTLLIYEIYRNNNLKDILDIDEGIEHRILKSTTISNDINSLICNIKSKRYTYNKISRMLNHILLNFTKEDALLYRNPQYIRILGLSTPGKNYINSIKKNVSLPILSKYEKGYSMLEYEINITRIYSIIMNNKNLIEKEYKSHTIIK